jgi:uncharacterized protein (UPF0264 family)
LLVSVRDASEAEAVLRGGADIVDAKEPARGALGTPSPEAVAAIVRTVGAAAPVSVALGDPASPAEVAALVAAVPPVAFVKLGFAGAGSFADAAALVEAAIAAAGRHRARPRVIAAAYADAPDGSPAAPGPVLEAALRSGAAGILVDTSDKRGSALPALAEHVALGALVRRARAGGLLTALAGRLTIGDLGFAARTGAEVIGVRGAACDGGREGRVSAERVAALRRAAREELVDQRRQPAGLAGAERG